MMFLLNPIIMFKQISQRSFNFLGRLRARLAVDQYQNWVVSPF